MKWWIPSSPSVRCLAAALLPLLSGCGHMLPEPDESCGYLVNTFHRLAAEKDRGATLEEQRQQVEEKRSYPSVKSYLNGVLAVIYRHPELDADQIRTQVRDECRVDSVGRVRMPPDWSPWTHS